MIDRGPYTACFVRRWDGCPVFDELLARGSFAFEALLKRTYGFSGNSFIGRALRSPTLSLKIKGG